METRERRKPSDDEMLAYIREAIRTYESYPMNPHARQHNMTARALRFVDELERVHAATSPE